MPIDGLMLLVVVIAFVLGLLIGYLIRANNRQENGPVFKTHLSAHSPLDSNTVLSRPPFPKNPNA